MEKNKVFDVSLDSMMNSPIEVEAAGESPFPEDLYNTARPSDKDKVEKAEKSEEDDEKDLIDLENIDGSEEDEEDEEIDDTQKEDPSSKKQPPQTSKSKTSSPLTPYAQLLIDEGILPNLDIKKFDGSADSLKDAMVNEIVGAVESYKESLPEKIKSLINNYEEGVPLEKLLELDKVESDITKVTEESLEEDTSLQKKIVTDYLKRTTKFSDSKINKLVDAYEDSGELEDEAKSSLTELQKFVATEKTKEVEKTKAERAAAEEQRKKDLVSLQDKIKTTEEIIPGLKLNQKIKDNVFASMTTPVGYDQAGRPVNKIVAARMENPVEFEMKLHYLFEVTKGFKDFSKLVEKGKKDASRSFEEAVDGLDKSTVEDASEKEVIKKSANFFKSLNKTYNI